MTQGFARRFLSRTRTEGREKILLLGLRSARHVARASSLLVLFLESIDQMGVGLCDSLNCVDLRQDQRRECILISHLDEGE